MNRSLLPDCLADDAPCRAECVAAESAPKVALSAYIPDGTRSLTPNGLHISDLALWEVARHEAAHGLLIETLTTGLLTHLHAMPTASGIAGTVAYRPPGSNPGRLPLVTREVVRQIAISLSPLPGGTDDIGHATTAALWIVKPCVMPRLLARIELALQEALLDAEPLLDDLTHVVYDAAKSTSPDVTGDQVRALLAETIDVFYEFGKALGPRLDRIADAVDATHKVSASPR